MVRKLSGLLFLIALLPAGAAAQTNVTNGNNGTTNTVPVYAGTAQLGNSPLDYGSTSPFSLTNTVNPSGYESYFELGYWVNNEDSNPADYPEECYGGLDAAGSSDGPVAALCFSSTFGSSFVIQSQATTRGAIGYQFLDANWNSLLWIDAYDGSIYSKNGNSFDTGNGGVTLPGIAPATGGPNCLQIATDGTVTNTGLPCSSGGSGSLSLTTNGNSGAATFTGNVLNIPQYSSGGGSYTFSTGLTNTSGTITNNFAVGISGGQTVFGGTQTTDKLVLQGTKGNGTAASAAIQMTVGNNGATAAVTVQNSGNVGIGTTTPGKPLDVSGTIRTSAKGSDTGGVVYPDGTQQTTAWTGVLCGGDYAEDMRARGNREKYQPGDVLVLASGDNSDVQKSSEPYSALVAGIFATKPGVIGRRAEVAGSAANIPMAMVGVVPTKVSTENGPIHRGDLLVTSSTAGYAMKGTDRSRMLGAVLGKAMGSLDAGSGVIEVLVTLQ